MSFIEFESQVQTKPGHTCLGLQTDGGGGPGLESRGPEPENALPRGLSSVRAETGRAS